MELDTIISAASALAALLSALYTASIVRLTKKSTEIAVDEHREKHEAIHGELTDSVSWETDEKTKMLAFACSLVNRATSLNTIIKIELHVHEYDNHGQLSKLILQPTPTDFPLEWNLQPFPSPLTIDPRSATSGWVSFRMPDHYAKGKIIDKYEIIFLNALGQRISLNQYLIRKVENVKTRS
jgi:hypothetical protein